MMKFYLEVDNRWDSFQTAANEREAVEKLFPVAEISCVGADSDECKDFLIFEVKERGEVSYVYVSKR